MTTTTRKKLVHLTTAYADVAGWYLCTEQLLPQGWDDQYGDPVVAWEDIDGELLVAGAYDPGADASETVEAQARKLAAERTGLDFGAGVEMDGAGLSLIPGR